LRAVSFLLVLHDDPDREFDYTAARSLARAGEGARLDRHQHQERLGDVFAA
jgi:hypothetical protein